METLAQLYAALNAAKRARTALADAADAARDAVGEDGHAFVRLDSHYNDVDETIDYIMNEIGKISEGLS